MFFLPVVIRASQNITCATQKRHVQLRISINPCQCKFLGKESEVPLLCIEMWQVLVLARWTSELEAFSRRFEAAVVQIHVVSILFSTYPRAYVKKADVLISAQCFLCSMIEITHRIQGGRRKCRDCESISPRLYSSGYVIRSRSQSLDELH